MSRLRIEDVRLTVARAYAMKNADAKTLARIEEIDAENEGLRGEIATLMQARGMRPARKVIGLVFSSSILALALALSWSWLNYSYGGYCERLGFHEGFRNAPRAAEVRKQFCGVDDHGYTDLATASLIEAVDVKLRVHPFAPRGKTR